MQATVVPKRPWAWTLGNLLMLVGFYLLTYVGGIYADEAYGRAAARGDSDLPLPVAEVEVLAPSAPAAFVAPSLDAPSLQPAPVVENKPQGSTITRIVIPRIDVDSKVIEVGWRLVKDDAGQEVAVWDVAKYAVGHHQGSANPGDGSNIVMAGHVGGAGPVFARLIELQPGDQLTLYSGGQQHQYVVKAAMRLQEVGASEEERLRNAAYMDPTDQELLTLITCWPAAGPHAFDQRIVIQAEPLTSSTTGASPSN